MPSFYRNPEDPSSSSSSSSEASDDRTEDDEPRTIQQGTALARVHTLDSNASEPHVDAHRPSLAGMRQGSIQDMSSLGFHAMLEDNAINAAAARMKIDAADPEAQRQGRAAYQQLARTLPPGVDSRYSGDEFRTHRASVREGISKTIAGHLNTLPMVPEDTQALVMHHRNGNPVPLQQPPHPGVQTSSGLPAPTELYLRGYPDLQNDRYMRDFSEIEIVGKGGYGKVFKVKHKLDGSFYAVKRIAVPAAKLAKVQQHGPEALNSMLEEVRSLARFDHANIVRYHNAWLEFTAGCTGAPIGPTPTIIQNERLLEDPANFSSSPSDVDYLQTRLDSIRFEESSSNSGADILFEASDTGEAEHSGSNDEHLSLREQLGVRRKKRRSSQASQATIATISSSMSRMSAVEDVAEDYDGEIEMIPRRHRPSSQDPTSDLSDSMISHSDLPVGSSLIRTRTNGPVLTLNVQMSLYESNLAAFLSTDRSSFSSRPGLTHCFHPCVSLELLSTILYGVEYLHDQGVVHRDLKPANIFLSLNTGRRPPSGSVNLSTCKSCSERERVYVVPRIGDFGLVTALDENSINGETITASKPVGTEFYRPEKSSTVSEKLDVFALGVIALEMLCRFGTRMERSETLSKLRKGEFPDEFAAKLGPHGDKMQQLIGAMVVADETQRMGCDEARSEIGALVEALKA